jgi:5-methylcytosine-specific restriction protein A
VTRNPSWKRDELILALDLYFRHKPSNISKTHPEVVALSKVLNALPIHGHRPDAAKFRNANGVYMKLCNFLHVDPSYHGKGLTGGGAEEKAVWDEFAHDPMKLGVTAAAIKARLEKQPTEEETKTPVEDEDEFPEGTVLFRSHRSRERNRKLVARAKALALKAQGKLACAVCAFDFGARYGKVGAGYIEAHHTVPISQIAPGAKTKVKDIALLCSNCHRMAHRRPSVAVAQRVEDARPVSAAATA